MRNRTGPLIALLALAAGAFALATDTLGDIGQALRKAIVAEAQAESTFEEATTAAADAAAASDRATRAARQSFGELEQARLARKRWEAAYQKALAAPPPDVTEPPDPPAADDPWTFAYAEMTLAEAKLAARARVEPLLLGPETRVDVGYDIVYPDLHLAGDNGTITNESRFGRWGKAYGCNKHIDAKGFPIPRQTVLVVDNCVSAGPWPGGAGGWKWFFRMSNMPEVTVSRCAVYGQTVNGRQAPKEHAFYYDVSGNTLFTDCLFMNLGGHGWYINNRPEPFQQYGRISLYYSEKPTHRCVNVVQIDGEQDASRGAFNFTINDAGSYEFPGTVILEGCISMMAWDYQRSQGNNERHPIEPYRQGEVRSSGSMVATNYVYTGQEGWPTEQITLDHVVFWAVQGRHSLASLRNAENYLFKDSFFKTEDHANPFIEIGAKRGREDFREPARVVIENCMDVNADLKIWTDSTQFEVFDINSTIGKRWIWTPEGVTLEAL